MKKAKKKHKKLSREQDGAGGTGSNLKNAGTVLAAALIGEIVEATVERLLKRMAPSASSPHEDLAHSSQEDSSSQNEDQPTSAHSPHLVASLGHLPRLQNPIRTVKSAVREAVPHVIDSVKTSAQGAIEPLIEPLIDRLEAVVTQPHLEGAVGQALDGVANLSKTVTGPDTPKNLPNASKKGKKKSKKKGKSSQ